MGLYRKLPVTIEAIQFTDEMKDRVYQTVSEWQMNIYPNRDENYENPVLLIPTLEGEMTARLGDWIIKGVNGEVYPCKDDIFKKTYELIEE
jgi:hypothetical protein